MATGFPGNVPTRLKAYTLSRVVGAGAMGTVYEGTDVRTGSRVAIKLMAPALAASPDFRERFEREAHVAALLRSPYTVHTLDFGEEDGWYFLVMEFIDGNSLAARIAQGPLALSDAFHVAIDIARALEEAGARGVVHRDIKPENVMLTSDGRVKVADFGIARQAWSGSLTSAGGFVGTALYAAPEQVEGTADHRSDIYAVGVCLYAMLAGYPPFRGSPLDVLRQHMDAPLPLEPLRHVPEAAVNVIRRCMEKDPADRYQTASELIGAIERAQRTIERRRNTGAIPPTAPGGSFGSSPSNPSYGSVPSTPSYGSTPSTPSYGTSQGLPVPPRPAAPPPAPSFGSAASIDYPQPGGQTRVAPPVTSGPVSPQGTSNAPTSEPRTMVAPPPGTGGYGAPRPGVALALAPVGAIGSRSGWTRYNLAVGAATAAPMSVQLAARDPDGACEFRFPNDVSVTPGQPTTVSLEVRPLKRRWLGATVRRQFWVYAGDGGGGSGGPVSTSGEFDDVPRGWPVLAPVLGVAAAAALIPGVIFAMGGFGGGGDNKNVPASGSQTATHTPTRTNGTPGGGSGQNGGSATPTSGGGGDGSATPGSVPSTAGNNDVPPSTATATATASSGATTPAGGAGTATPTATRTATTTSAATATPTATTAPPTATPTPIPPTATPTTRPPTATPTKAPGIHAGTYTYTGDLVDNTCSFGPTSGSRNFSFSFTESGNRDGIISPGERITVYDNALQYDAGTYAFSYPNFVFNVGIRRGTYLATQVQSVTFDGDTMYVNSIVEQYNDQGCEIRWG
jgi:serine/threonine-protein kinase